MRMSNITLKKTAILTGTLVALEDHTPKTSKCKMLLTNSSQLFHYKSIFCQHLLDKV